MSIEFALSLTPIEMDAWFIALGEAKGERWDYRAGTWIERKAGEKP